MNNLNKFIESKNFISIIQKTYDIYFIHGSRSSKKVDYFHSKIKELIEDYISINNLGNTFKCKLEINVPSINSSGKKKCDIVILKNNVPYTIFPVKIIMTNYKQNKNNSWENLTGELCHLKWHPSNNNIHIIPINIILNKIPYLDKSGIIKNFENITFDDIKNYYILNDRNITYNQMNFILDVEHQNIIGENFNKIPIFKNFNVNTKYISINEILEKLLNKKIKIIIIIIKI